MHLFYIRSIAWITVTEIQIKTERKHEERARTWYSTGSTVVRVAYKERRDQSGREETRSEISFHSLFVQCNEPGRQDQYQQ